MKTRLIILVLLACLSAAARADRIALRPSADVEPSATITLRDVATLEGELAEAVGDVVIVSSVAERAAGQPWFELPISDIRAALDDHGVNWGRLSLQGGVCTVRTRGAVAPAPVRREAPAERTAQTYSLDGPATVRSRVVSLLTRLYGVDMTDLRLLFDEDDEAFLSTPEYGRRIDVQPAATPSASRFAVVVWIYEGERVLDSRTLRIDLQVRQPVLLLTRDIQRGDAIRTADVRAEVMWIEPTGPTPIRTVDAIDGAVARKRLTAGTTLRADHLESPVVVRRGELVTVHCISGGIVLKTRARAKDDAREGDTIEFQMDGRRKTFVARVVARGRAIMNLDGVRAAKDTSTAMIGN